ncbi:MAG: OmpH family outer membrane protein [Planctomycetota bacterium]
MNPRCSLSASASCCRKLIPAIAAACAALFFFPSAATAAGRTVKIGIVDVHKVLERLQSWREAEARLAALGAEAEKKLEEQAKEIDRIEAELRYFKPGSKDHEKRKAELTERAGKLARSREQLRRALAEQSQAAFEAHRKAITEAVADYADVHGLDLVADARSVIYAAAGRDISLKVALEMNKRYKDRTARERAGPREDK